MRTVRSLRALAALALVTLVATACGDDGPTYPSVFDPAALQSELGSAEAALTAPATRSFSLVGYDIDYALLQLGGGGAALDLPALLLAEEGATPSARVVERARLLTDGELRTAAAIPPAALGGTFEWDVTTDQYQLGDREGAPANGVRFILYAIDPITDRPAEPLVEAGYVDLTRSATTNSATARVQVFGGTVNPVKVLDYSASIEGTVTVPTVRVSGFAKNASDSLNFSLTTSVSLAAQSITLDWRTSLPTRDLASRVRQTISGDDEGPASISLDSWIQSANGRVDLDGVVNEATGGTLVVRVNGDVFAQMTLAASEDTDPVITGATGAPLTAEEEELLRRIFLWFGESFLVYLTLLAPVGTLLDAAF